MKKTLLTFCLSLAALCGMAQTQTNYNEKIVVTIDGVSSDSIPAAITVVDNGNGTCDFSLKNFKLEDGESLMLVGNIDLKGVSMTEQDGVTTINTDQNILIQPGDDPDVGAEEWLGPMLGEEEWLGPMLGEVPIKLSGKLSATHLYVNIDIDMQESLGQIINVAVGQSKNVVSGIHGVKVNANASSSAIYTLSGLRVNKAAKGVYIVNGKKVIK